MVKKALAIKRAVNPLLAVVVVVVACVGLRHMITSRPAVSPAQPGAADGVTRPMPQSAVGGPVTVIRTGIRWFTNAIPSTNNTFWTEFSPSRSGSIAAAVDWNSLGVQTQYARPSLEISAPISHFLIDRDGVARPALESFGLIDFRYEAPAIDWK